MPERRNPVVRTGAILRKGGVHTKSVSGQRHRQKLRVDDAIDEWYEDIDDLADSALLMDAEIKDRDKRHVNKQRGKNGRKKGQSGTAPSFIWGKLRTENAAQSLCVVADL